MASFVLELFPLFVSDRSVLQPFIVPDRLH